MDCLYEKSIALPNELKASIFSTLTLFKMFLVITILRFAHHEYGFYVVGVWFTKLVFSISEMSFVRRIRTQDLGKIST